MSSIKIIYVDDRPDKYVSQYLLENYKEFYEEITFTNDTYENLLITLSKKAPFVLLIDSKLFENNNAGCKFTGEELMLILKKQHPFSEIFIITQNANCEFDAILKYRYTDFESYNIYYNKKLLPFLKKAEEKIELYFKIIEKMSMNTAFDHFLIEKIKDSIVGINNYNNLKAEDIDRLVEAFKELKEKV